MTSDDIRISCYLYGGLEIQNASHYDSFLKRSSNTNSACLKCYMRKKRKKKQQQQQKNHPTNPTGKLKLRSCQKVWTSPFAGNSESRQKTKRFHLYLANTISPSTSLLLSGQTFTHAYVTNIVANVSTALGMLFACWLVLLQSREGKRSNRIREQKLPSSTEKSKSRSFLCQAMIN